MYDPYVELIKLLRADGELDKLRSTREKMSENFPLTEGNLVIHHTLLTNIHAWI